MSDVFIGPNVKIGPNVYINDKLVTEEEIQKHKMEERAESSGKEPGESKAYKD